MASIRQLATGLIMKLKSLVAGIVGSFAITSAAYAADPIIIPPPAPPPPVVVAPAGFNWNGIYAGAHALGVGVSVPFAIQAFGGQVGFNMQRNNLVFGGEAGVLSAGGTVAGFVSGKVGVALGATQRVLVYGTVLGLFAGGGGGIIAGGGAALGIGQNLSVFAEGLLQGGACCFLRFGANFHFGN
jgi:hypothetical protein